jgi:phospholysine phosphohistidine inorganic pyrophosphate phosphatase
MSDAARALLIDLDGVIYQGDRIVPGALESLNWLEQQQIPHLFVTNTTSCSCQALLDKFSSLGFDASLEQLATPITAANQWMRDNSLQKGALFVSAQARADFPDIESVALERDIEVDAVVIGDLGNDWDYRHMNQAFRFLMRNPETRLIALGMTRYWQSGDGLRLDVAPFVRALECAADCEALVVGKPAPAFFESALETLGYRAENCFMIGDDVGSDIDAAQQCGIRGILVKTGKFRDSDLSGRIRPFALLESIASLPDWWSEHIFVEPLNKSEFP